MSGFDLQDTGSLQALVPAGLLVLLRIGSALVTAPVFSSVAIPMRVKAVFVFALAVLVTPAAASVPHARIELSPAAMLGEVAVGLCMGLSFAVLNEALLFTGSLMSMSFSFSLANLMDPNSQVETAVLGTLFSWMGTLILLAAGLHRTLLAAVLRSVMTVPLGHAPDALHSGHAVLAVGSGIFFAGLQLAAPVISASLVVEVVSGLLSRMAPTLPAQVASVPVKTVVSYMVLIGSLALWPRWVEQHFSVLLDAAQKGLHA